MHFCCVFWISSQQQFIWKSLQPTGLYSEALLYKRQFMLCWQILFRSANVHQSLSSEVLACPWSFSMIRLLEGALVMSVKTNVDVSLKTWRMTVHDARSSMWKPAWRSASCCRIESGVWSAKNCNRKTFFLKLKIF